MASDRREILLDLIARNKMGGGTDAAARDLDKVGNAAQKLGRAAENAQDDVDKLDRELKVATAELAVLAAAFSRADSAAERLDLAKGIRKSQSEIKKLSGAKGILNDLLPDPGPAGKSFVKKLGESIGSAASSIGAVASKAGPYIGVALGAAVAPALLATVGSAISAGVGVLGLGAAVALAIKKDTGIQDAAKKIGGDFFKTLSDAASKSFAYPLRASLGILNDLADRSVGKLAGAFDKLAPSLTPLVHALAAVGDRLVDMFVDVSGKSGPAIAAVGDSLKILVDGVADFVESVATGSQTSADALRVVVGVIADIIRWTGQAIGVTEKLLGGGIFNVLVARYHEAADASGDFAGSQAEVAKSMTNAEKAATGEVGALKALSDELRAQTDPVFGLLNAQDKLAAAQKNVKDATDKHGKSSKEAKAAVRDLAEAALDLEGKVGELGGSFNGSLTPAMRATFKAAGLTDKQINSLEGQFREARSAAGKFAGNYKANVSAPGAKGAIQSLYTARDAANAIPNAVAIAIRVTGVTNVSKAAASVRKQYARARGGPITAGLPYWVGEEGPELVFPEQNGKVIDAQKSRAIAGGRALNTSLGVAAAFHGANSRPQSLRLEFAGQQELVTMFRYLVRSANLLQG